MSYALGQTAASVASRAIAAGERAASQIEDRRRMSIFWIRQIHSTLRRAERASDPKEIDFILEQAARSVERARLAAQGRMHSNG